MEGRRGEEGEKGVHVQINAQMSIVSAQEPESCTPSGDR